MEKPEKMTRRPEQTVNGTQPTVQLGITAVGVPSRPVKEIHTMNGRLYISLASHLFRRHLGMQAVYSHNYLRFPVPENPVAGHPLVIYPSTTVAILDLDVKPEPPNLRPEVQLRESEQRPNGP